MTKKATLLSLFVCLQYFVSCSLGAEYMYYCMIILYKNNPLSLFVCAQFFVSSIQNKPLSLFICWQYFVSCSLGAEYVGYCMIILGTASVGGTVLVALVSHRLPREIVLGFGGVVHMALMIGFLIWIPSKEPKLFLGLSAAWGVCDAVWQTQCNSR
jgi:hypothetical protein